MRSEPLAVDILNFDEIELARVHQDLTRARRQPAKYFGVHVQLLSCLFTRVLNADIYCQSIFKSCK